MIRYELFLIALFLLFLTAVADAQPGRDMAGVDADGDGTVSRLEFEQWSATLFDSLDANGDGVLGEDEQPLHHRRQARSRARRGLQGGVLAHASDADTDGTVTTSEWNAFLATLDVDAEGVVSPESLQAALPQPPHAGAGRFGGEAGRFDGERPAPSAERFARVFDRDGDGVVELADLETTFGELDQNGDGELTSDEIPQRRSRAERGDRSSRRGRRF